MLMMLGIVVIGPTAQAAEDTAPRRPKSYRPVFEQQPKKPATHKPKLERPKPPQTHPLTATPSSSGAKPSAPEPVPPITVIR
jgi:hypothetical protein